MDGFNETLPHAVRHERKHRRFNLQYPVLVQFLSGQSFSEVSATSRNVSVGGLLLEVPNVIPQQAPVSFTIKVQGGRVVRPVHLRGEGHVVRVADKETGKGFAIAVQCKNPIMHLEELLHAQPDLPEA